MDELKALIISVKEDKPDFGEPWQADAFVMALSLSQQGYYNWNQWVDAFAGIIASHPQLPDETAENAYYRQWLTCMEKMMADQGLLHMAEILIREEKWRYAYLHTPHGHPVELNMADTSDTADCHDSGAYNHSHKHEHHHGHACLSDAKPLKVFRFGAVSH